MIVYYAGTDEGSLDKTTERDGADADENGMVPLAPLSVQQWKTQYADVDVRKKQQGR